MGTTGTEMLDGICFELTGFDQRDFFPLVESGLQILMCKFEEEEGGQGEPKGGWEGTSKKIVQEYLAFESDVVCRMRLPSRLLTLTSLQLTKLLCAMNARKYTNHALACCLFSSINLLKPTRFRRMSRPRLKADSVLTTSSVGVCISWLRENTIGIGAELPYHKSFINSRISCAGEDGARQGSFIGLLNFLEFIVASVGWIPSHAVVHITGLCAALIPEEFSAERMINLCRVVNQLPLGSTTALRSRLKSMLMRKKWDVPYDLVHDWVQQCTRLQFHTHEERNSSQLAETLYQLTSSIPPPDSEKEKYRDLLVKQYGGQPCVGHVYGPSQSIKQKDRQLVRDAQLAEEVVNFIYETIFANPTPIEDLRSQIPQILSKAHG
eukprot:GHVN01020658.1.p1 GENE.GHVN01020658.1~~GHVN01020658.1.p1  ORF type:complete len:380 (-),score=8.74 GHVN01020658.1:58-1197(-)